MGELVQWGLLQFVVGDPAASVRPGAGPDHVMAVDARGDAGDARHHRRLAASSSGTPTRRTSTCARTSARTCRRSKRASPVSGSSRPTPVSPSSNAGSSSRTGQLYDSHVHSVRVSARGTSGWSRSAGIFATALIVGVGGWLYIERRGRRSAQSSRVRAAVRPTCSNRCSSCRSCTTRCSRRQPHSTSCSGSSTPNPMSRDGPNELPPNGELVVDHVGFRYRRHRGRRAVRRVDHRRRRGTPRARRPDRRGQDRRSPS